jgi:hypothetical protein
MPNRGDKTQQILEYLLGELYKEQSQGEEEGGDSYLQAQDGQYLGRITTNKSDNQSIINKYGPFGSKYSKTSIFNKYSPYGSRYGSYSVNNPHCIQPPRLIIKGDFISYITKNRTVRPKIDPYDFIERTQNDIGGLLGLSAGQNIGNEFGRQDSYIMAADGTFLGELTSNSLDSESVFNEFGKYGSKFSTTSIFNDFSSYGGRFSSLSPFNSFTSTPPKIFINGDFWGYLTVNDFIDGQKLNPNRLKDWVIESGL